MIVCERFTDYHFFSTSSIVTRPSDCYPEFIVERKRIILYGDSLILAGVQASLGVSPHLEVIVLDAPAADLAETLRELRPAAVIFDLGSVPPDFPLAIVPQPNLLLIGVDPSSNDFLVLSSHLQPALGVSDLMQAIEAHFLER